MNVPLRAGSENLFVAGAAVAVRTVLTIQTALLALFIAGERAAGDFDFVQVEPRLGEDVGLVGRAKRGHQRRSHVIERGALLGLQRVQILAFPIQHKPRRIALAAADGAARQQQQDKSRRSPRRSPNFVHR